MATIGTRLRTLEPGDLITLWILDLSPRGGPILRFYNPKNATAGNIVFQGNTYTAFPIKSEGYEISSKGTSPRPIVTVGNVNSYVTNLVLSYGDLVGSIITRKRTLAEFLDGQPGADPTQELGPDIFVVERKRLENNVICEFELATKWDAERVMIPRRNLLANSCQWLYRGEECGYAGPAVANIDETQLMGTIWAGGVGSIDGTRTWTKTGANFTSADLGRMISSAPVLPTGTGIAKIVSVNQVLLTKSATSVAPNDFIIVGRTNQRGAYNSATTYNINDEAYTIAIGGTKLVWYSIVASNNFPLTNTAKWKLDRCGKRVFSCKCRFGPANPLRTSAYPGIDKLAGV